MINALTQTELDALGCSTPGCTANHDVIYYHCGDCHDEDENLKAFYEKPTGEFVIECSTCKKEVLRVAVQEAAEDSRMLE